MNLVINEQIAPDIARAIIAQATAKGLSVNDYLRKLLGLNAGAAADSALAGDSEESPPRNEAMFAVLQRSAERMKDVPVDHQPQT